MSGSGGEAAMKIEIQVPTGSQSDPTEKDVKMTEEIDDEGDQAEDDEQDMPNGRQITGGSTSDPPAADRKEDAVKREAVEKELKKSATEWANLPAAEAYAYMGESIKKLVFSEQLKVQCPIEGCQFLTAKKTSMIDHLNSIHIQHLAFTCPHCSWNGKSSSRYHEHLRRTHHLQTRNPKRILESPNQLEELSNRRKAANMEPLHVITYKGTTIKVFNPGKGNRLTLLNSGPFDINYEYPVHENSDVERIAEGRLVNILDSKASTSLRFDSISPRFVYSVPFTKKGLAGSFVKVKLVGVVDISLPSATEISPGDLVLAGHDCDQMFCVDPTKLSEEDELKRLCGLVLSKGHRSFDGNAITKVSVLTLYSDSCQITDSQIPLLRMFRKKNRDGSRASSQTPTPGSGFEALVSLPSSSSSARISASESKEVLTSMPIMLPSLGLPSIPPPMPIPAMTGVPSTSPSYSPSFSTEVLMLLRVLDPRAVPVWLVVLWFARLKGNSDIKYIQRFVNMALEELSQNGVIKFNRENLSFSVVAFPSNFKPLGENPEETEDYTGLMQVLIEVIKEKLDAFDYHQPSTWKCHKDVIHHVMRLVTLPIRLTSPGDFASVLYLIAEYLRQVCQDYDQAHLIHRAAFEIRIAQHGDLHHLSAFSLAALGRVRQAREQISLAREILDKALAIEEVLAGEKHSLKVAKVLLDLGSVAMLQGSVADSVSFLEKCFAIRKAIYGSDTKECVEAMLELANVFLMHGNLEKSKLLLEHSQVSLRKLGLEDSHHLGAVLYFQLGRHCIAAKNPREAVKFVEKSRDLRIRLYGTEDHPEIVACYEALATLALDQSNFQATLAFGETALSIGERLFDMQQQPVIARTRYVLARLCARQYHFSGAREHLKAALEILRRLYQTEDNHFYIIILRELGFTMFNEGNYKQGELSFKRVIDLNCRLAASDSYPGVASDLYDLGRCMALEGELPEAVQVLQKGLEIKQLDDQSLAKMLQELGWIYMTKESGADAINCFGRCLQSDATSRAKDEALMATMFHELGRSYYEESKFPEAIAHFHQSLEMSKRFHGTENHPNFATTLGCLAQVYFDLGLGDVGKQHLQRAYVTCRKTLGESHPTTHFFKSKFEHHGGRIGDDVIVLDDSPQRKDQMPEGDQKQPEMEIGKSA